MKNIAASKASRRSTLLRLSARKAARKTESRRKRRKANCELYANPNSGARPMYGTRAMNGNFRPISWVMQYHNRVARRKIVPK